MLNYIQSQHVSIASGKLMTAVYRSMRAFTDTVGIAVCYKSPFEFGFYDVTQGMMHDPVAECGGANQPALGFMYDKAGVRRRLVGLNRQLALKFEEMVAQLIFEAGGALATAFSPGGFAVGQQEIVPCNNLFEA